MKEVNEKKCLIEILGTLVALKFRVISVDESEKYIFSPKNIKKLYKDGISPSILKIIELGCELEDIESLLYDKFDSEIEKLIKKTVEELGKYSQYEEVDWD